MPQLNKPLPVNRCIYCGTTERALTDEHIIAYGLSGDLLLPKASCHACNKVTGQIEEKVLRGFTQQARIALGLRSRRPKKAPKTFVLSIVKDGKERIIRAPANEHFVVLPLPLFEEPVLINGKIPKPSEDFKEGIGLTGFVTIWLTDPEEIRRRYDADTISVEHKVDQIAFAKMLAKIGYCQAIAQFGLHAIRDAYVLPAILGERNDIGRWVRSSNGPIKPEVGIGHQIFAAKLQRANAGNREELIVAHIHLFAHLNSPAYMVIVGENKTALRTVMWREHLSVSVCRKV
jgi:hypothetical protein